MKRNILNLIAVAILLLIVTVSCQDKNVTGVIFNEPNVSVELGETVFLKATVLPEDATNKTVTWRSSNVNVAVVNRGSVTGKQVGSTVITVTTNDGGFYATCIVNVVFSGILYEPEMVFVEGGTFVLGCTNEQGDDCEPNEIPAHEVTLSSFQIGKYEVTQKEWVALMGTNPSAHKGDTLPVEKVSWNEVQDYIKKLNEKTGKRYRLPTEAEWEYAARGGNESKAFRYSGSHTVEEVAWFFANSNEITHPVGLKEANELDIFDMSGNVWEWCSDWYDNYSEQAQNNPSGPYSGESRVVRGGGYNFGANMCRVSFRGVQSPDFKSTYIGFRLVLPQ